MKRLASLLLLLLIAAAPAQAKDKRPNFLVIVADDLGYSDLGAFGGEINTPHLDKLALAGVRLAGFHTAPTCSPTRSMLLSGTDNHIAGLGTMAEMIRPNQKGQPGYEGYLRSDVATLAERLAAGGYATLFSGKWHLGLTPEQDPHARGFRRSFALLQGGHNHFGTDVGTTATYTEQGKALTQLPADFYSSDYFATRLIDFLGERAGQGKGEPFFAYLAFTAPHWPLQAHPEDIARYKGRYDDGFDALRARRLARQRELGILAPDVVPHTQRNRDGSWDSLTADQQRTAARNMEIYAAMVDRMDKNVGRVIEALRASGELDNTVVLFLADNGAEALDIETSGAEMLAARIKGADNGYANRGKASSYITYGAGWAGGDRALVADQGLSERGRHARGRLHQRRRHPAARGGRDAIPLGRRRRAHPAGPRGRRCGGDRYRGPDGQADHRPLMARLAPRSRRARLWRGRRFRRRALRLKGLAAGRLEAHRHRRRPVAPVRYRARSRRDARPDARRARAAR